MTWFEFSNFGWIRLLQLNSVEFVQFLELIDLCYFFNSCKLIWLDDLIWKWYWEHVTLFHAWQVRKTGIYLRQNLKILKIPFLSFPLFPPSPLPPPCPPSFALLLPSGLPHHPESFTTFFQMLKPRVTIKQQA